MTPFGVERLTGIEPALSAWEADLLPLQHKRIFGGAFAPRGYAADESPMNLCHILRAFTSRRSTDRFVIPRI